MKFAIVNEDVVVNIAEAPDEFGIANDWIASETAKIGDAWDGESFTTPIPVQIIPESVTALQGLLALEEQGLSQAYEEWASSNERTFVEKAFINKAITWKRTDPVLQEGAAALGLSTEDLDSLFLLASTK